MPTTPSSAVDDSTKQRKKSSKSRKHADATSKERRSGEKKSRRRLKEGDGESSRDKRDLRRQKPPDARAASTEKKEKSESRRAAERDQERRPSVDNSSSTNKFLSPNSSVGLKRLSDEDEKKDRKGDKSKLLRQSSNKMSSPNPVGQKHLSDEIEEKMDKRGDSLKQLRKSSHSNKMSSPNFSGHKHLSGEDDNKEGSLKQLRKSSHSNNMSSPNFSGHKRLSGEDDNKEGNLKQLRKSSHSNKMISPESVARKRLSDDENKKDESLKQLRQSSHSNKMTSPNNVSNKRLSDDEDKRTDTLKELRRSSHSGSVRSMSTGKNRSGSVGNDKEKRGSSRLRLGGRMRKKKTSSTAGEEDASEPEERKYSTEVEEEQSKRRSVADKAKKRLTRKTSLDSKASAGSNKSVPKRFSKVFRRSSSDEARHLGRSSSEKEDTGQPKRRSLDSSLEFGKSLADVSDLDPKQKQTRAACAESHNKITKPPEGNKQSFEDKKMRKSLKHNVDSSEDLDSSDDDDNGSSVDENDETSSPSNLGQSTRRTSDSSHSIPKEFRKSRLDLLEQNTKGKQNARSASAESIGKAKAKRLRVEKFKKKDPSQKKDRRSKSLVLIADKRKVFKEKGRASIDASFTRRKSKELAKLSSRRRNSGDKTSTDNVMGESEKEEESKTRAGEPTSELESLMQKNAAKAKSVSVKSSKSSGSSDKKSLRKRKKRKRRRKWFSFCCCAMVLLALIIVGIIFMFGRAYYKAEIAKTDSTTRVIGEGTPKPEQALPAPSPAPIPLVMDVIQQPAPDVAVVIIVQLDDRPDETGFSLISADNTTTYVYYPFGSLAGQQSDVITDVLNIPADTEVLFTFMDKSGGICCDDGKGYYRVFTGSGESKKSLISGDRNSEFRFTPGSDIAIQTSGIDPNESCKPCPDGKQCGRCAWCNADRGFLPDTIFSYQCHTPLISITEKCFIGAKRVQLHNQYVAAMTKCTSGFEPWPQLQSTSERALCVSEAKCIKKYSFVDPDCESELSGSLLVRESCQDVIGGLPFGYEYGYNAPREQECLPGTYSMADFAEAIASRCCVDGVAFCSTFGQDSVTTVDSFLAAEEAIGGAEPTLSPTDSLRPTISNGYQMTIVIMLDKFPKETGFTITSKDSKITYMSRLPGYYRESNKLIVETVPLLEGSDVIFTITDKEGDGICCENGEGYFQIYTADGSLIVDEIGKFASSKSVDVFAGTPLTLPPTVSLVPSSSSAPSQGLYPITIAIQFDQWATETGISITSLDGDVLYEMSPGSFAEPNQRFVETVQLPYESEVIFSATDEGGDGFCCMYGDGSISIFSGSGTEDQSALIESKTAEFQSELSFSFRVGEPPSAAPAVTFIPTASKTILISESPTVTSQPTVRSLEVTVVVQFDKYSAETGFFIDSADGLTNFVARPLGYFQNEQSKKVVETFVLPEGLNYRFKIIDLFGDGTCCWAGAGYYSVYEGKNINDISSQLLFGDGEFGLEREHFFTLGKALTPAPSISFSPTVSPSISPTSKPSVSASPTETMYIVGMTIKLDSRASETGFYIASVSDGAVYFDRPPGYYNGMDKETIEESIPLPAGQYQFALLDTGGDGFCCQNGFGFYSLYENANGNVLVFSDAQFENSKNETFSVGDVSDEAVAASRANQLRGSHPHRLRIHAD